MSGPEEQVTEEQVTEQINVPKMLAMTDAELRNVLSLQEGHCHVNWNV
jgi:predicted PP-loop superfamily ATPase